MSFDVGIDTYRRQTGFILAAANATTELFAEVADLHVPLVLSGLRVFARDAAAPERVLIRFTINGVTVPFADFTGWDRTGGEPIPLGLVIPPGARYAIQAVNSDAALAFDLAIHVFGRFVS